MKEWRTKWHKQITGGSWNVPLWTFMGLQTVTSFAAHTYDVAMGRELRCFIFISHEQTSFYVCVNYPHTHTHRTNNPSSFLLVLRLPFSSYCRTSAFLVNFIDFSFPYCDSSPIFTSLCPPTVLHQSRHPPSDNPSQKTGSNERIPLFGTNWMGINFLLKCASIYQKLCIATFLAWYTGYNKEVDLILKKVWRWINVDLRIYLIIFDISLCTTKVIYNKLYL